MPSAAMTAYKALLIRPTSSNPVLASDGHLSGPRGIRVRHYPEPVCGQDYYVGSGSASRLVVFSGRSAHANWSGEMQFAIFPGESLY